MNNPTDSTSTLTQPFRDPAVRRSILSDPRQYALDNGLIAADAEVEVKVMANTADTMYVPMPHLDDFDTLNISDLRTIQAAGRGTASTAGCGGSASTLSTVSSTYSTASTASTLASGGCASDE